MEDFLLQLKKLKRSKFYKPIEREPMLLVLEKIQRNYEKSDCDYLQELARAQKLIVKYTKEHDYEQAQEIIDLSKKILHILSKEPRSLGKIFVYPSFAYNAAKNKNYSLVKKYINWTIKNDDLLTDKFPVLHFHKLHHILNLNQIYLANCEETRCANLLMDIFNYLTTFEINPTFGKGNKEIFDKMAPEINLSTVSKLFNSEYFLCAWQNPFIENILSSNAKFMKNIKYDSSDEGIQSFKDYFFIQQSIFSKEPNFDIILLFFKKYNLYLYDPFRLLILKNLFYFTLEQKDKKQILWIIENRLNFKHPSKLVERIVING